MFLISGHVMLFAWCWMLCRKKKYPALLVKGDSFLLRIKSARSYWMLRVKLLTRIKVKSVAFFVAANETNGFCDWNWRNQKPPA